ncbi:hypothetical protein O6H91_19G048900 [Diphasiastrum complanatum]|uniref:Uncharacterized protein n=1 Tax=Diphasiastrum complanatum TaxID=34168 RepID=A0ACC2AUY0_DIPCM|nr:hypothetical protein O6H91_19G048900 [Diphasiastrum complanatum]
MEANNQGTLCGLLRIGHRRSCSETNHFGVHEVSSAAIRSGSFRKERASSEVSELGSGKRVIVAVDNSDEARVALLWALSHVVHKLDVVTLLHVLDSTPASLPDLEDISFTSTASSIRNKDQLQMEAKGYELATSLKNLCLTRRPEVEVEVLIVEGEKGPTIVGQAKKLEASILVLGQTKPGLAQRFWKWNKDKVVDFCIENSHCLALAVRRKSKRAGGYLINSKWQKNFWLLA